MRGKSLFIQIWKRGYAPALFFISLLLLEIKSNTLLFPLSLPFPAV